MKILATATALALVVFCTPTAQAHHPTIFDLLYQKDQVLDIYLFTDLNRLIENKKTEEFQQADFSFRDVNGLQQEWTVRIRPRGRYRRRVCDFPPIKIKFPKEKLKDIGFSGHNDLKLVTHCLGEAKDDELVLREYLVYKMYRMITPLAFRAQLVRITYVDGMSGARTTRLGILLEDEDELAERHQREVCDECFGLPATRFDEASSSMVQLFQYMVGNADWSLSMKRNVKLLQSPTRGSAKLTVVPYDFDFATLVDAPYAKIEEVDFPSYSTGTRKAIGQFLEKRDELEQTVASFEMLEQRSRKKILRQIDAFYRELERKSDPDKMP